MAAKKKSSVKRPHGQMRRSQLVGASGPGALLDLPRHAVIVGGLEYWGSPFGPHSAFQSVDDERARARLAREYETPGLRLFSPPVEGDSPGERLAPGVSVFQFPGWFIAQKEVKPGQRPLVEWRQVNKNKWEDDARKKWPVVPVRFVRACKYGHLDDIRWREFAHRGQTDCKKQLYWKERGTSFDFGDISVTCDCGKERSLLDASKREESHVALGWCNARRPWLEDYEHECKTDDGKLVEFRLLVRNASNAYFSLVDHSISIPEPQQELRTAVGKVIDDLLVAQSKDELKFPRRKASVQAVLGAFSDDDVWAEMQRRADPNSVDPRAPKLAELQTFLAVNGREGKDEPESLFFAREVPFAAVRPPLLKGLSKVLLVERLREISVQVGFTRFEAPSNEIDGELDLDVKAAHIAKELKWLPAVENRGEGIFIGFDKEAMKQWAKSKPVLKRKQQLDDGFQAWARARDLKDKAPPPVEYVMLHSLAHLLVTALSLDCGYAASSIRERVYAFQEEGFGILLHTGTPDAEGTLGGLVNAARDVEKLIKNALELGAVCSNDPICAQHRPDDAHEERFLHGAACHGCVLLPETSCEMRNDFLDRSLVLPTVDELGCHFFEVP